jgi:FAD-dependent oxidoreductase domain-containing protein 1
MVEYDVLIIGAGILGLSTAYHLKRQTPNLNVLVVDKAGGAGRGSTAKSAAAFRCFFSSSTNFALADSSVEFYKHLQKDVGMDLKMRFCGYLWCFQKDAYLNLLPTLQNLAAKGFEHQEYSSEELAEYLGMCTGFEGDQEVAQMNLGNVHKGLFIPKAGLIGALQLVKFYESEFLKLGGKTEYNIEVTQLLVEPRVPLGLPDEPYFWQEAAVVGAKTTNGEIRAKKTIVAAGPWSAKLLDPVGVECFIKPKKRQIFWVKANNDALKKLLLTEKFSEAKCLPLTVLPKLSIYIRPDDAGNGFMVSYADDFPRAFSLEEHPQPEPNFFKYRLHPVIKKYFPQFADAQSSASFAGLYEINTLDGQPVVFEENGLLVVGGASGSGIMKADAIGRIAAALHEGKESAELFGGRKFNVSSLSLKHRSIEQEKLII